jgi:ligand-binding sensor domain-containing protein
LTVDKNNILWLYSVINGGELLKFDGTNFNIITTSSVFPPGNAIVGLAFDSHNNLWIASIDGVFEFNGNTWESFTTQNSSLPENNIMAIAIDSNDNKWFGCIDGTVVKYTGN